MFLRIVLVSAVENYYPNVKQTLLKFDFPRAMLVRANRPPKVAPWVPSVRQGRAGRMVQAKRGFRDGGRL